MFTQIRLGFQQIGMVWGVKEAKIRANSMWMFGAGLFITENFGIKLDGFQYVNR